MTLPTPWTIEVRDRVQGQTDAFGNEVVGWSAWRSLSVMGWAQVSSSGPKVVGDDRVVVDLEVYSPERIEPRSEFRLPDGRTFYALGDPEDWNHGPFGFAPGFVVNGRHVVG